MERNDSLNHIIDNAVAAGMTIVAGAGNGAHSGLGGCLSTDSVSNLVRPDTVIGVSAVKTDTVPLAGYQYGSRVFIAAPTEVQSDSAAGVMSSTTGASGTSASTPHVTGAVALLLAQGYTQAHAKRTCSPCGTHCTSRIPHCWRATIPWATVFLTLPPR